MILVTVGTERYPFNRLMRWIDVLLKYGFLNEDQEEVIVQYGSCTILPAGVKVYSLLPETKFHELLDKARLIIAHCGEGTINLLEETTAPYILVPRSHRLGEHIDNHQIELANALAQSGSAIAWSPGDLVRFITNPERIVSSTVPEAAVKSLC